ncbi:uncharacterized protein LOC117386469 isoform X1 [Periophthalmus magnuspinnatus]|uniref:uncharacterized protein LOC117386469 isoform X1 n=1 Tax=Periophthalmus magnuspinnatus TaxID=409849 RepID=UPI00145BCC21|nr:uncharacterized protein LOC117386469 isoform X1 [Periophthalmus magnuspinnatus]
MDGSILTIVVTGLYIWVIGAFGHKNLTVGGNITLSCSNISKTTTQVDWFRVENGTKACCISSLYGYNCEPSYCSGFKHRRFQMSANVTDVFLTIYEVKTSDSGLYFCGFFIKSNIVLGEATYLSVEGDGDPIHSAVNENSQTDGRSSWIFLMAISLGLLSGMLATVVIILVVKYSKLKKVNRELQDSAREDRSKEVNYAAVNIKATKRPQTHRQMETHVIYSSTR